MFSSMDAAINVENYLGGGDSDVVDPGWVEDVETGAVSGAGHCGEARAAGAAMQVDAKFWFEAAEGSDRGGEGLLGEDESEAVFGYDGNVEVGAVLAQQRDCRSGEDAIPERAQTDDGDAGTPLEGTDDVDLGRNGQT